MMNIFSMETNLPLFSAGGFVPQRSPLWPAAVCRACWPTAVWPQSPSSSAERPERPASAATPSCGDQTTPAGRERTRLYLDIIFCREAEAHVQNTLTTCRVFIVC